MDDVTRLLNGAKNYPRNLARSNTVDDSLESYFEKINERQGTLFTPEKEADLGFCELSRDGEGSLSQKAPHQLHALTNSSIAFWGFRVNNAVELLTLFGTRSSLQKADPRCRFLFVGLYTLITAQC